MTQYQFYSTFFGKCFGLHNMVWYAIYQALELVIAYLYVTDLLSQQTNPIKPLYAVYHMSPASKFLLFVCVIWFVKAFDKCLATYSSIAAGMTLNEFLNAWNYKYLY